MLSPPRTALHMFLHCAHARAQFKAVRRSHLQQHLLQRADHADSIEIIVIAEMRDANILPFISPWPFATTIAKRSRNSFTIALESTPLGGNIAVTAAAGHVGANRPVPAPARPREPFCRSFGVVDERIAAVGKVAVTGLRM